MTASRQSQRRKSEYLIHRQLFASYISVTHQMLLNTDMSGCKCILACLYLTSWPQHEDSCQAQSMVLKLPGLSWLSLQVQLFSPMGATVAWYFCTSLQAQLLTPTNFHSFLVQNSLSKRTLQQLMSASSSQSCVRTSKIPCLLLLHWLYEVGSLVIFQHYQSI